MCYKLPFEKPFLDYTRTILLSSQYRSYCHVQSLPRSSSRPQPAVFFFTALPPPGTVLVLTDQPPPPPAPSPAPVEPRPLSLLCTRAVPRRSLLSPCAPQRQTFSFSLACVKATDDTNPLFWAPTPSVLMYGGPAPSSVSSKPSVNPAKPVSFPPVTEKDGTSARLGKLVRAQPGLTSRALLRCVPGVGVGTSEGVGETQTGGPVPVSVSLRGPKGRAPALSLRF